MSKHLPWIVVALVCCTCACLVPVGVFIGYRAGSQPPEGVKIDIKGSLKDLGKDAPPPNPVFRKF